MIDMQGQKAKVLAALYNASKPLGMGFMHFDPAPMTEAEAAEILSEREHFDYLKGRVMKLSLSGESFDPRLYDRDNGEGAAARAVAAALT
jgi:hypothetical protein